MKILMKELQHRATVKQRVTYPNSNTEVEETTIYTDIPCHISRKGDKWINIAFGTSNLGKWTMIAPHTWQGNKIQILVNYFVYWNDTVNGVNRRLMVIGCNNEFDTHVQVDLEEMT